MCVHVECICMCVHVECICECVHVHLPAIASLLLMEVSSYKGEGVAIHVHDMNWLY